MRAAVLTVFDACVDMIVDIGAMDIEFDQKEKLVQSTELMMGGSNCIFACQCAKLGLETTGVGLVGKDAFGLTVIQGLESAGVDTSLVRVREDLHTAVGISLNRGSDRAILTDAASIEALKPTEISDAVLQGAKHLHIGSYYLLTGLRPHVGDLLKRAKALGLTTSLDTNWDPSEGWELPREVLKHVDLFLPNETEARRLSGKEELDEAAAYFLRWVPAVVIKTGKTGASLYRMSKKISLTPPQTQVVDTVGAGDSFDGGFVWAKLSGLSDEEALRAALFCGSMNTRGRGGCRTQTHLSELEAFLKQ